LLQALAFDKIRTEFIKLFLSLGIAANLSFEFEVVDLQNLCGDFYRARSAMTSFARMNFHVVEQILDDRVYPVRTVQ